MSRSSNLTILLFAFFLIATLGLLGAIAKQGRALGLGVELAQGSMAHDDKMHIVLDRIDDFDRYRQASGVMIVGRTATLRGIADLSGVVQGNLQYLSLALLACLAGLLATGVAMYMRLRAYEKRLACSPT